MRSGELEGNLIAPGFDLALSMGCGQVFGWSAECGRYWGIVGSHAVALSQQADRIGFVAEAGLAGERIRRYLGLDLDLSKILRAIAVDPFMKRVLTSVRGLRLLRQDPWPCLCGYILSASNRIERIDRLVIELACRFGHEHVLGGRKVYRLPDASELAGCPESDLRACGVGFRAPYLAAAAMKVADGEIDFEVLRSLPYEDAKEALKTIPGVGDKIADCVLLFSLGKYEAFPVDVWIKRAMEDAYFGSRETRPEEIGRFGREYFGRYAGYAQEYIYHFKRTCPAG
jgi:N-glycosylase/DNA lyase